MNTMCFFIMKDCLEGEECEFWDTNRNYCELKNRVDVETATNGSVTLNTSTFTKIVDANASRNTLVLCHTSELNEDKNVFISLSDVSSAVDGTGYYLKGGEIWSVPEEYVGEVCAKAVLNNPIITYIEI